MEVSMLAPGETLQPAVVRERRERIESTEFTQTVMFRVMALYGISRNSLQMPLNESDSIESGQICVTLDPDADPGSNVGAIDFTERSMIVRYGAQMVFPGLYKLISERRFDPSLLHPVRATATDHCTLTEDLSGFRALGCLEFLPGSIWAGANGG
jgi:hypothetical protein